MRPGAHQLARKGTLLEPDFQSPPRARFDAPGGEFQVHYCAYDFAGAFVEALLRQEQPPYLTWSDIVAREISILKLTRPIRVIPMHGKQMVQITPLLPWPPGRTAPRGSGAWRWHNGRTLMDPWTAFAIRLATMTRCFAWRSSTEQRARFRYRRLRTWVPMQAKFSSSSAGTDSTSISAHRCEDIRCLDKREPRTSPDGALVPSSALWMKTRSGLTTRWAG